MESLRKTLMAGLGVVSFTKERLSKTIDELVQRGELTREQGGKLLDVLLRRGEAGTAGSIEDHDGVVEKIIREVQRFLAKGPLVTRSELRELLERVDELESTIAQMISERDAQSGRGPSSAGASPGTP